MNTKKPCEKCNWKMHYQMKLDDLKGLINSFPPRHGDFGLIYDKHEVDEWLDKARRIMKS
jgi:hypothetical protein